MSHGNPMKEIRLEKVTINIGAGEAGPKLETAKKLLEKLSGAKVVVTLTHKRTTFGGAKKRPIGVKVTLRGEKAKAFLANALKANESRLRPTQFDSQGNFSLGIREYIDLPGVKYDPDIGILGMDVCATLTRPGYRVARRKIRPSKIGKKQRITAEEAKEWVAKEFNVKVSAGEE
jgi:large subunit ribosomal protein L5